MTCSASRAELHLASSLDGEPQSIPGLESSRLETSVHVIFPKTQAARRESCPRGIAAHGS